MRTRDFAETLFSFLLTISLAFAFISCGDSENEEDGDDDDNDTAGNDDDATGDDDDDNGGGGAGEIGANTIAYKKNFNVTELGGIYLINTDGSGDAQISGTNVEDEKYKTHSKYDIHCWNSDRTKLLASGNYEGADKFMWLNPKTGAVTPFADMSMAFKGAGNGKLASVTADDSYIVANGVENMTQQKLYKISASTGETTEIVLQLNDYTVNAVGNFHTSPSGSKIAIQFFGADGGGQTSSRIYIIDLEGKEESLVTSGQPLGGLLWISEDTMVIYNANTLGEHGIATIKTDGSGLEMISVRQQDANILALSPSPDGKKVLFGEFYGGDTKSMKLFTIDLASKEVKELPIDGQIMVFGSWKWGAR